MEEEVKKLNEKWKLHEVVDTAVRSAMQYNESSRESAVSIAELKTNQQFMGQEISEIKDIVKGLDCKLDNVIANSATKEDINMLWKKKAGAWVEKVMWGAGAFLAVGFFGYIGNIIIKVIEGK